ncbi:MAG: glycosyltransferase [Desulfobulbaceae bacterium]|nr:glycosyltransferase [Desulfobulbaceae bacterium]
MSPEQAKKISVIIPTYNRISFLTKAVDSVFGQSCDDYELIVVDDGSNDRTADYIAGCGRRVRYIYQENQGPAAARNRGIRAAAGDFIAFLDSDDWFDREKLAVQSARMEQEPDCLISHTDEIWYRRGKLLNQKKKHFKPGGYIYPQCLKLCVVSMSTVMVRRELFDRVGVFDESLPCCEDYDFWLRASLVTSFLKISKPLTLKDGGRSDEISVQFRTGMDKFRVRSLLNLLEKQRLTNEQRKMAQAELARKCRIYGNGCLKHGRPEEGEKYLDIAVKYMDRAKKIRTPNNVFSPFF